MMDNERVRSPGRYPVWEAWPVAWSAVWVGALTAMAVALIIGLIAIAVGAHELGPNHRLVSWHTFTVAALIFGVCGGFFSNVAGGWVATRIAGIMHAESAMLHGAIVWVVTIPALVLLATLGAGPYFGAWAGGLAGTPAWVATTAAGAAADPQAATIARNEAVGALLGILVGLMGGVLGAWLASGEPMTLGKERVRHRQTLETREYTTSTETIRVTPLA